MSVDVTETVYPLLTNGGSAGTVFPAYVAGLGVGAFVILSSNNQPDRVGKISGVAGGRVTITSSSGDRMDLSGYRTSDSAYLTMPAQTIQGIDSVPTLPGSGVATMNKQVITNGSMTGTAVLTSLPLNISQCSTVSFIAVWSGTPLGTFTFETTSYPNPYLADGVTPNPSAPAWTALTLPAAFASGNPAGSTGNFDFQFFGMGEMWIHAVYTNASSTGVLNVWGSAKG